MAQPVDVLIAAFSEGAKQFTTYIALGTSAALSALVLDDRVEKVIRAARQLEKDETNVEAAAALVELHQDLKVKAPILVGEVNATTARWILIGLVFVTGVLAANALDSLIKVLTQLANDPQLKAALCLYPSLATGGRPLGYMAAAVPGLTLAFLGWRDGRRVREAAPKEWGAPYFMGYVFAIPYLVVVGGIYRLPC